MIGDIDIKHNLNINKKDFNKYLSTSTDESLILETSVHLILDAPHGSVGSLYWQDMATHRISSLFGYSLSPLIIQQ